MPGRGASVLHLTLVGPDGQAVSYRGQAIPGPEGLRVFLANGWRPAANSRVRPAPAPRHRKHP
jgi:hypothetical protein